MTIAYQLEWIRTKAIQEKEQDTKLRDSIQSRDRAFEESVKTRHTSTIQMKDAYQAVLEKNHKPTPEEIHLRRFTSGSWVDSK
jgi:hypothetical protein